MLNVSFVLYTVLWHLKISVHHGQCTCKHSWSNKGYFCRVIVGYFGNLLVHWLYVCRICQCGANLMNTEHKTHLICLSVSLIAADRTSFLGQGCGHSWVDKFTGGIIWGISPLYVTVERTLVVIYVTLKNTDWNERLAVSRCCNRTVCLEWGCNGDEGGQSTGKGCDNTQTELQVSHSSTGKAGD